MEFTSNPEIFLYLIFSCVSSDGVESSVSSDGVESSVSLLGESATTSKLSFWLSTFVFSVVLRFEIKFCIKSPNGGNTQLVGEFAKKFNGLKNGKPLFPGKSRRSLGSRNGKVVGKRLGKIKLWFLATS